MSGCTIIYNPRGRYCHQDNVYFTEISSRIQLADSCLNVVVADSNSRVIVLTFQAAMLLHAWIVGRVLID